MKKTLSGCLLAVLVLFTAGAENSCTEDTNKTARVEQARTEENQSKLLSVQPPPKLDWSLERDNLIKRFKLQNDRAVNFYMYVFIEGVAQPVGYYQINKVSSVDSQLTNPAQIVKNCYDCIERSVLPSPAEDGSYGTNGSAVFGFTPEEIYIEHNLKYLVSTIPLTFAQPVVRLAVVKTDEAKQLIEASKKVMAK